VDLESLAEATSGAVGSLISTTILYPLDTCKTKYQAEARSHGRTRYRFSSLPFFSLFLSYHNSALNFNFFMFLLTPSSWGDRKWFLCVPPAIGCFGSGLCLVVLCSEDGDQTWKMYFFSLGFVLKTKLLMLIFNWDKNLTLGFCVVKVSIKCEYNHVEEMVIIDLRNCPALLNYLLWSLGYIIVDLERCILFSLGLLWF